MQSLTIQVQIRPTVEQQQWLRQGGENYIRLVNRLTEQAEQEGSFPKITTKDIHASLPSAVSNQAIRDAKSVYRKIRTLGKRPILRKRVYYVNNQNYSLTEKGIAFPLFIDGKAKKTEIHAHWTTPQQERCAAAKLGLLRVVEKSHKWFVQLSLEVSTASAFDGIEMGIDLGIKVPAVAVTRQGKTRFFGNGRMNKFVRRRYQARRRKLGKLKKLSAIRKSKNKEQRWMIDQNHKISRKIVQFAKQEGVSVIKLERLENIRKTARTSRKNNRSLHRWAFYQLQQFIAYKARLAGIQVVFVNPAYTSQTCPVCGIRNKAKDRKYTCGCGFHAHRDRVAGMNIVQAPGINSHAT